MTRKQEAAHMNGSMRRAAWLLAALGAMTLALAWATPVWADGGAPNLAYVVGAGSDGQGLAIIDIGKKTVVNSTHLGGDPAGIVLSLDNRFAYITQRAQNQVAVFDTRTYQIATSIATGTAPQGIAIDISQGSTLYVANSGGDTVSVVDGDKRTVRATITVGQHPGGVAIAGVNTTITDYTDPQVYVADTGSDAVTVIDSRTAQVVATVPVPGGPLNVSIPAVASVAYVTTQQGTIDAISLRDDRFLGTILSRPGDTFGAMDYDAITNQVFVPDLTAGQVLVLRPVAADSALPSEPLLSLPYADAPAAIAITFDGALGFVAQQSSGQVTMLDMATHHTITTITVGGTPRAVLTGSYPPLLDRQTANIVGIALAVVLFMGAAAFAIIVVRRAQKGEPADVAEE
jgi:YVTN family beta-propeller protein